MAIRAQSLLRFRLHDQRRCSIIYMDTHLGLLNSDFLLLLASQSTKHCTPDRPLLLHVSKSNGRTETSPPMRVIPVLREQISEESQKSIAARLCQYCYLSGSDSCIARAYLTACSRPHLDPGRFKHATSRTCNKQDKSPMSTQHRQHLFHC